VGKLTLAVKKFLIIFGPLIVMSIVWWSVSPMLAEWDWRTELIVIIVGFLYLVSVGWAVVLGLRENFIYF